MNFYGKDELGIVREYSTLTEYEYNHTKYVIYTDFVPEPERDFRLFVGSIIHNKVMRVKKETEEEVLRDFKQKEENLINQLKERFV